jgi:hypothetical protein
VFTSNQGTPSDTLHSVCSLLTCVPTPFLHLCIQRGRPPRVPDAEQPKPYHALTHVCTLSPHPLLSPHPSRATASKRVCEARSHSSGAFVEYGGGAERTHSRLSLDCQVVPRHLLTSPSQDLSSALYQLLLFNFHVFILTGNYCRVKRNNCYLQFPKLNGTIYC